MRGSAVRARGARAARVRARRGWRRPDPRRGGARGAPARDRASAASASTRFEREERGLLEAIEATDQPRSSARAGARARRARGRGRASRARRARAAGGRGVEARLARTRALIAARAVALYKAGELGPVAARVLGRQPARPHRARPGAPSGCSTTTRRCSRRFRERSRRRSRASRARGAARAAARRATPLLARLDGAERRGGARARTRAPLLADVRQRPRARARAPERARSRRARARGRARRPRAGDAAPGRRPAPCPSRACAARSRRPSTAACCARFGRVLDAEFGTATFRKGVDFAARARRRRSAPSRTGEVRFAGWFARLRPHGDPRPRRRLLHRVGPSRRDRRRGRRRARARATRSAARARPARSPGRASTSRSGTGPRRSIRPTGSGRARASTAGAAPPRAGGSYAVAIKLPARPVRITA